MLDSEVLRPRQIIGSVPWALIAQQANEIVPDPNAPRFEDCADGTLADHQTGLQWEKKTGTLGTPIDCQFGCPDPHDVNNRYQWSDTGTEPDGGAFTDFLAKLNDPVFGAAATVNDVTGCFAGHCDWRLPNIVELQTIRDCGFGEPCIDPILGPSWHLPYWSASTQFGSGGNFAWYLWFSVAGEGVAGEGSGFSNQSWFVRAVRTGSCN